MSANCCTHTHEDKVPDSRYRRVLWAVLALNGAMFLIEIIAGVVAGSASLQADALDFLADAANYLISLFVVGMALRYRASAALAKGVTMGLFGLWVVSAAFWHAASGTVPEAATMGAVGIVALLANAASFALLWAYRGGDSNMRSAWLCSRNDVIGNFAVLLAALGVFNSGKGWPDIFVALLMACFALQGAWLVIRLALAAWTKARSACSGLIRLRHKMLEFGHEHTNERNKNLCCSYHCFSAEKHATAQSVDQEPEPAVIVEVGGAAGRDLEGGGSSFGGDLAVEFTPIEKWLEIEAGTTPLFRCHWTEWDTDLLFKKPEALRKNGIYVRR